MNKRRLTATCHDITVLTSDSIRQSQRTMQKMREHYNKQPHERVTIKEMANYLGIPFADVLKALGLDKEYAELGLIAEEIFSK